MFKFNRTQKPEDLDKKLVFSLARLRRPRAADLKFLPRLLTPTERWVMRGAIAILLIAFTIVLARFFADHLVSRPRDGGTYREAIIGQARLINPVLAITDADKDLSRLIYAGLLMYNEQGALTGDLAEKFEILDSGKTIIFHLREEIFFHDKERMDAQDVTFTIAAIKDPSWRSPLWRSFQDVTVETPDSKTVIVRSQAFTPSLLSLFTVGILPKHIWEQVDPQIADRAVWNVKPVGSGPFEFHSLAKSRDGEISLYKLARVQNYHHGRPHIKELVLQFVPDFESALSAFREHTVDGVSFVPERLRGKVPGSGVNLISVPLPRFTGLFFQDRKSEPLKEAAVRRALEEVLDRQRIAESVRGAEAQTVPFLEGQIGYTKTKQVPPPNLNLAAQELKKAGWVKEADGWMKNKKKLAITLTTLDEPINLQIANRIKQSWEELGIEVALEAAARVTFEREVLRTRAYEILLFSILGGSDPDPYTFWHSSQIDDPGLNLSSIKSRNIDLTIEQGRATADPLARFRNYLEFQRLFEEEVPGIILYASSYDYAISKRVKGVAIEQMYTPADRFNTVQNWFLRSRIGWK